jgi:cytochrome c-type biogenesis protein CcmH
MNPTPEEIERLQRVSSELRCLVCQNQSIAESTAGLAVDLKQQALEQIQAGKSDEDIRSYMVERYGDFILYKPAFSASNAVLWGGPFVLLALVFVMVIL